MSSNSLQDLASNGQKISSGHKTSSLSTLNKKGIKIPWIGKLRHPSRLCLQEWFFLLGAACMYSITLGFTLQRIIVVEKNTEDFTFALMLIIHIGFCSFHVLFGMFSHRPYEIMAHLAGLSVIVLDCTLNLALTNDSFDDPNEKVIKVVRLSLVCFGTVLQFTTGVRILGSWLKLFKKPGCAEVHLPKLLNWLIYKLCCSKPIYTFHGSPEVLRERFNRRYFCCTLLTMDLQYEVILIVLVLEDGISDLGIGNNFLVFWVLTPYALLYFIVGHVTFRVKSPVLVVLFLACSWPLPVFIVKMVYDVIVGWSEEKDHMLEIITLFLAFIGLVMRVTVFVGVGWPCLRKCNTLCKRRLCDTVTPSPTVLETFDTIDTGVDSSTMSDNTGANPDRRSSSFLELQGPYAGESTPDVFSNREYSNAYL